MKKNISILIASVVLFPLLASCQNIVGGHTDIINNIEQSNTIDKADLIHMPSPIDVKPVLDSEIELKLRESYRLSGGNPEDIWVVYYFGNYSGCEVLYVGLGMLFPADMYSQEAAGYAIVLPSGQSLTVYKDSEFYGLGRAYDLGLITKNDVYNIGKLGGVGFIEQYPEPLR
ncbi:MAG: hypothetical protein FWF18_02300 [Dehalococcoidia bacterium]|nr:hypothetical protein [Dehalococcoidia bacterium]